MIFESLRSGLTKEYSNIENLEAEVSELQPQNLTYSHAGLGRAPISEDSKVQAMGGERPTYDWEETIRELGSNPRTKYRARIIQDSESARIKLAAMIGPLPTMTAEGEIQKPEGYESIEEFVSDFEWN